MSSPPVDKPYKSRLFNFLNSQYIRIHSGVNRKLRQWGIAVRGGLEIVLFPFLRLWEIITKTGNKSFASAKRKSGGFLPEAACDKIIRQVTEKMVREKDLPVLLIHEFQGLACRLQDGCIVGVMANNQVREIIPRNRQQEISELIEAVLASNEVRLGDNPIIVWLDRFISAVEGYIFSPQPPQGDAIMTGCRDNDSMEMGRAYVNGKEGHSHPTSYFHDSQDEPRVGHYNSDWLPSRVKTVILAAINYFFGKKKKSLSPSSLSPASTGSNVENNPPADIRNSFTPPSGKTNNAVGISLLSFEADSRIHKLARKIFSPLLPARNNNNSSPSRQKREGEEVVSNSGKYNWVKIRLLIEAAIDYFFGGKNPPVFPRDATAASDTILSTPTDASVFPETISSTPTNTTITPNTISSTPVKANVSDNSIPQASTGGSVTSNSMASIPTDASLIPKTILLGKSIKSYVETIKTKITSLGGGVFSRLLLPGENQNQIKEGSIKTTGNQSPVGKNELEESVWEKDNPFQLKLLIMAAIEYFFGKNSPVWRKNSLANTTPPLPPLSHISHLQRDNPISLYPDESVCLPRSDESPVEGDEFAFLSFPPTGGSSNSMVGSNSRGDMNASVSVEDEFACLSFPSTRSSSNPMVENSGRGDITTSFWESACLSSPTGNGESTNIQGDSSIKQAVVEKNQKSGIRDDYYFADREIEVDIVETRYEKHLLQVILEKLDELMLWLEELIIGVVRCVGEWLAREWSRERGKIKQQQEDKKETGKRQD